MTNQGSIFIAPVLCMAIACAQPTVEQSVRLDFNLRGSCGRSTQSYDLSCVSSLDIKLLDPQGMLIKQQCLSTGGRFPKLHDLVASATIIDLLDGIESPGPFVLEMRAYHSFDKAPCTDMDRSELMLWGTTPVFSLDEDPPRTEITLTADCRPDCDCEEFDSNPQLCPASLGESVCTPLPERLCRKPCETSESCFGGELSCVNLVCEASPGKFCAECVQNSDCDSGYCITNNITGELFCAQPCPDSNQADACIERMSCRRIDGVIFSAN